jgi:meiotically up-regulated gene 157 (Mug157) protein
MDRRKFIKSMGLAAGAMAVPNLSYSIFSTDEFKSLRPSVGERKFTSEIIEKTIQQVKAQIKNPELAWLFENCFPNTLDTTVEYEMKNGKPDTFVITGDIHAMWLRDSTAQVWPYLPFANKEKKLALLIEGLINRQAESVLIDPYANAFNKEASGGHWQSDNTDMKMELHERKWEIDSLCYTVRLAYHYWKTTGKTNFFTKEWKKSAELIIKTFREQQRKENQGPYRFTRNTEKATDTQPGNGFGNPVNPVGLICSSFRPSDDATIYPFLIPSNYFAVVSLKQLSEIFDKIYNDRTMAKESKTFAYEVENALNKYAVAKHLDYGNTIAFEVDGFGNKLYMDDANIPSLISLPYLGAMDNKSELYQNTRKFVLSKDNPWYFEGKAASGIGGPHVGVNMIWPMSIIMQALTSDNKNEIKNCINTLINTHGGKGFMHETFHKDDPKNFTRSWFAWANTLFGELILKTYNKYPELLKTL